MRIGAVITIVAAHDARNAAPRLTQPVSSNVARPESWAVSGRACARKNTVRVSTTQLRITMHALE